MIKRNLKLKNQWKTINQTKLKPTEKRQKCPNKQTYHIQSKYQNKNSFIKKVIMKLVKHKKRSLANNLKDQKCLKLVLSK